MKIEVEKNVKEWGCNFFRGLVSILCGYCRQRAGAEGKMEMVDEDRFVVNKMKTSILLYSLALDRLTCEYRYGAHFDVSLST